MKKRILFVCSACLFLSVASYAQETTTNATTHVTPSTVLATPSLKAQAEKIQLKEQQLSQAATSSRGVYAQLKQELNDLNAQYKVLLTNEIALTANDPSRRELEAELNYVEQQLTSAAVTNQR